MARKGKCTRERKEERKKMRRCRNEKVGKKKK
jgi:hypothetical protein